MKGGLGGEVLPAGSVRSTLHFRSDHDLTGVQLRLSGRAWTLNYIASLTVMPF